MNVFVELGHRNSDIVKDALTRKCEVCKAKPGADCTNIVNGYPLQDRVVHYARTAAE